MLEIIAEKWELQGWRETPSGNWYNQKVCRGMAAHIPGTCDWCGHIYLRRKYKTQRHERTSGKSFCSRKCRGIFVASNQDLSHLKPFNRKPGERPHNFIGQTSHAHGYVVINRNKTSKLQHRLVMEQHLGRALLREEVVHHRNGDKTDNRIENLEVLSHSEHLLKHWDNGTFDNRNLTADW